MKKCHKCGETLAADLFYKNANKPDGLSSSCRNCHRAWRRGHYRRYKAESDATCLRWRSRNVEQCKKYASRAQRKRRSRPIIKQMEIIYSLVQRAIHAGILTPQPCRICGSVKAVAHHENYAKPLDVLWYCRRHHSRLHAIVGSRLDTLPPPAGSGSVPPIADGKEPQP